MLDIRTLKVENVQFSFVCREGNVSGQLLVQWAALVSWTGPISISYLPSSILQAWDRDGIRPSSFVSPLFRNKVLIQKRKKNKKKQKTKNKNKNTNNS